MRQRIWWIWWVAVILAVAIGGATTWTSHHRSQPVSSSGVADVGGPFRLTDQHGVTVTDADLKGKPTLIFFGFTYCPEVCPTTLTHMSAWLSQLGPDANKINVVFVTVDPQRDTPKQMASYLSSFDPRIRGLTGTQAQTDAVANEYHVYHKRVPLPEGGYTVDHSAVVYAMDRDGHFNSVLDYQEPDAQALAAIRKLIAS